MSTVARYGKAVARAGQAMTLVESWEMIELDLLGGKGPQATAQP
jgi:hypothetical protein